MPDDKVPTVPDKGADGSPGSSFKNPEILSSQPSESMQAVYEILIQGNNLKTGLPSIVKSQEDLQTLYSVLYGNSLKAPLIDFSKKAVVIAAAGPFNTGGYSIVPVSAIKTGKIINLVFEVKSPGPKDMVTQAFTRPYVIVSVDAEPDTEIFIEINGDAKNDKLDF
ncbi:conserved domain protein [Treponema denticola ATCC 35405]|uniref:Conserved domain protein n=1 Tax=Treponema denticola (strain ATCC 35405 / DSM 14222 / CIP 103919 / JCM 8153 / KCTC 15104) TaxID=243275 RepID=Q73PN7_TREDE|nr:conserved domain protein [Treponema denticola ATCC 35405]